MQVWQRLVALHLRGDLCESSYFAVFLRDKEGFVFEDANPVTRTELQAGCGHYATPFMILHSIRGLFQAQRDSTNSSPPVLKDQSITLLIAKNASRSVLCSIETG